MKLNYKIADTVTPSRLYETNFYKILMLFPQLEGDHALLANKAIACVDESLLLKVKEQYRYTTELILYKYLPVNYKLNQLDMQLRMYHDAKLVEVIAFQGSKKLKKYENYPNKDMYLTDEKKQLNFHLQEILNMALNGVVTMDKANHEKIF